MAYFSNGTQMDLFFEAHCNSCAHQDDDGFCPIWDAHWFFMSDAIKAGEDSPGMNILNLLITEDEETLMPNKCTMRINGQSRLYYLFIGTKNTRLPKSFITIKY